MTLDQCLSCTRYEPIIGQVYAILDDSGTNIAQVLDDIQMSYMSLTEYSDFTRTDIHTAREMADLKVDSNEPPKFSDIWEEGFKMDWNTTPLENQRPNIAEYDIEGIEPSKAVIEKPNEGKVEPEFNDTIDESEPYETLKFNSEDYEFENFGKESNIGGNINGYFGMGATVIRNKIVEYARNAVNLCKEGKAGYSQVNRSRHLENAIDGISYWDCSSLVEGAYKSGGINSVVGVTHTEYPVCLPAAGGLIFPISELDKALPGDILFATSQSPKPSTQEELAAANTGAIFHVGIYAGEGRMLHASEDGIPLTEQIKESSATWEPIFAFGRPKELVEADSKSYEGATYTGTVPLGNYNYAQLSPAKKKWFQNMIELCIRATLKYPQLFASAAIIQGAIESGWGEATVGNNYFGIKADAGWNGPVVEAGTSEQNALGEPYYISSAFRRYSSVEESVFNRYEFLLENRRYREHGVFEAKTPEEQITRIHKAGYATDVNYSQTIIEEIAFRNAKEADRIVRELQEQIANENKSE